MKCNRCDGTGFLNSDQIPGLETMDTDDILALISKSNSAECTCATLGRMAPCSACCERIDVQVCDCCGNGLDCHYGIRGHHYSTMDRPGLNGFYHYNNGVSECH